MDHRTKWKAKNIKFLTKTRSKSSWPRVRGWVVKPKSEEKKIKIDELDFIKIQNKEYHQESKKTTRTMGEDICQSCAW